MFFFSQTHQLTKVVAFVLCIAILNSCTDGPNATESTTGIESIPVATSTKRSSSGNSTTAYPSSQTAYPNTSSALNAYPDNQNQYDDRKSVQFTIATSDNNSVEGTGPAELYIKIISVSHAGENLGSGKIGSDGNFIITLSRSPRVREILGIQLGNESQRSEFLDAPGTDMPLIGFIFDQIIVE